MILVISGFLVIFAEILSMLKPRPLKVPAILARTSGLLFTRIEIVFSFTSIY
jgi:hypothetical protein